jgi:carbon storage regulator
VRRFVPFIDPDQGDSAASVHDHRARVSAFHGVRKRASLQIGPDITVTVLGVHGNQVRLGITAPRAIVIDRTKIHARKHREYIGPAGDHVVSAQTVKVTTT